MEAAGVLYHSIKNLTRVQTEIECVDLPISAHDHTNDTHLDMILPWQWKLVIISRMLLSYVPSNNAREAHPESMAPAIAVGYERGLP